MFFYLALNLQNLYLILLGICFLVFLLIVVIVSISFIKYRTFLKFKKWESIVNDKITELIFEDEINLNLNKQFNELLIHKRFRNLCIEKIIETEKKFSGSIHQILHQFYENQNFKTDSIRKLSSSNYYVVAKGIQELTAMHVLEALPEIKALINHPKAIVYQEVQFSLVHFNGFDGLRFLNNFENILSNWQQLRLLNSITEVPNEKVEFLVNWLQSKNISVVVFSLKLIAKMQLIGLYPEVIKQIDDPNKDIQKEVFSTLQFLENEQTLNELTQRYSLKELEIKQIILNVLKNIKDRESIPFLKEQFNNEQDKTLKVLLAEVLSSYGEISFLKEVLNTQNQSNEMVLIINHALQEKI